MPITNKLRHFVLIRVDHLAVSISRFRGESTGTQELDTIRPDENDEEKPPTRTSLYKCLL
jgi:hypothetical protein